MRDEEMRGENLGDHRPGDRQTSAVAAPRRPPFVLAARYTRVRSARHGGTIRTASGLRSDRGRVRPRSSIDTAARSPSDDGPSARARAARRSAGNVDQIVPSRAASCRDLARSSNQHFRGEPTRPPVVRRRATRCAREVGRPRPVGPVAPRDAPPRAARQARRRSRARLRGDCRRSVGVVSGGGCVPGCAVGRPTVGVPRKTVSVDEMPSAYGSFHRCSARRSVALSPNSASPSTAGHL